MHRIALVFAMVLSPYPFAAEAQLWEGAKNVVCKATTGSVEKEINRRLLTESYRKRCTFVTDSDRPAPGCDAMAPQLASSLVDAKKELNGAGVTTFRFVVSGHTDSRGFEEHNKDLSQHRAAVIERGLVKKGIPRGEVELVGLGSERMLVRLDDTPAKHARDRRTKSGSGCNVGGGPLELPRPARGLYA